jgi:hypothetical protein
LKPEQRHKAARWRQSLLRQLGAWLVPQRDSVAGASLWSASKSLMAANLPFLLLAYGQVMVTGAVLGTHRGYDLYLLAWILPELVLFGVGNILQMHTIPALHAIEHDSGAEAYW